VKISFRQGIVRYQQDPSGLATFLKKSSSGSSIDLIAFNNPLIVTFAYRDANYLHEEATTVPKAWTGFVANTNYWLYIELDMATAQRKFGHTSVEPTFGSVAPTNPVLDQHWFDVVATTMKVWNGINWTERTRVFLANYAAGSIITPISYGSQVYLNVTNDAGFIIFDADGYPVRQHHKRKTFEYLTTSSVFNTVTAKAINMTLDALCVQVRATEPIPAFTMVSRDPQSLDITGIKLADCSSKGLYAIGLVQEDFWADEQGIITQQGYVVNEQWNFTDAPGTPLFLGLKGNITVNPAQSGFLQRIGEIVSPQSIYLNIKLANRYVDKLSVDYANVAPIIIDKVTGEQMISPDFDQLPINMINALLKDASKLPVTALGGPRKLLEEWTADLSAGEEDLNQRVAVLEALATTPVDISADYVRTMSMTVAVGGATIGTTFNGTVQDALDKILYPFGVPKFSAFSISGMNSVVEVGSVISGGMRVFNWTTVNPDNIRPRSIQIVDDSTSAVLAGGLQDVGTASVMIGGDLVSAVASQRSWTISAVDTQGGPLSKSYALAWRWKVYYGNNQLDSMIGADVAALVNSSLPSTPAGSYLMPAGGYKWLCYPSTFPTLTRFTDQATGLNIALNDPVLIQVTNQFGLVQTYKCHRTYNKLGSSITIVGS